MEIVGGIEEMGSRVHGGGLWGRPTAAAAVGCLACRRRGVGRVVGGRAGYRRRSMRVVVNVLRGPKAHAVLVAAEEATNQEVCLGRSAR
jgi:hypothetical protein